ncbi:hypothetical protein llap_17201 [Limosa lapponica baueri]|uniref:Hemicentin-1 n=1 Tax=Limosa lapponica baueri TaxID=1758121 RepID=A0A2I0TFE2_LIMLA|nr:hypothetical protein llap_17201 [Limosa lapponica baueri]
MNRQDNSTAEGRAEEPPRINGSDQPEELAVVVNNPLELLCISSGIPVPVISWMKDGRPLLQNDNVQVLREVLRITSAQGTPRVRILSNGRYLQINNADLSDTASYTCVASNIAGKMTREFMLTVHVPPTIAPGHTNITVTVNVQTTLPCETTGIPRPAISWKKNGQLLSVDQNQNTYRLLSSGSLVIISPTVDDTAVYECSVSNDAGEDQRAVELTVQVPPKIHSTEAQYTVTEDSQAVLSCVAEGIPTPTINWKKDDTLLTEIVGKYRAVPEGDLILDNVVNEDAGDYKCVATNDAGVVERSLTLTLQMDGNWGQWQTWSQCSASCGGGEQTRIRLCSNPAPLNRGRPCPGDSSQISRCNTQACPASKLCLVEDYTEDYIQTGPGQLYAHSTRLFTVDGVSVPYTWNHTITYDYAKGKMPFLVETLHASSITTEYNPLEETVDFKIYASIAKGIVPIFHENKTTEK